MKNKFVNYLAFLVLGGIITYSSSHYASLNALAHVGYDISLLDWHELDWISYASALGLAIGYLLIGLINIISKRLIKSFKKSEGASLIAFYLLYILTNILLGGLINPASELSGFVWLSFRFVFSGGLLGIVVLLIINDDSRLVSE